MELETLLESCPEYAKDLRLNLGAVLRQTELTEQQAWGTAASCAIAARNPRLTEAVLAEASRRLTPQALAAAQTAAAIMGMNNVFYRFRHLSGNPKYATMPARLRMQGIRTHGSDPVDFELWCLAVSAINGCGACIASHEAVLREKGINEDAILAAVRIASAIHALATVLDADAAVSGGSANAAV
ncbi:MAG: carboxymuconolactone decarboxylase family protein [Acidobacteriia bacterium]|nr:carboxymuconolactone decarboxylase family protein [Terriglobia bacterium]